MYKDLLTSIPGAHYSSKTFSWSLPLTYPGFLALHTTFNHELKVGERLKAWADEIYREKIGPSLALRDVVQAPGYPDLYPHQNAGVRFLTTAERALLCDGLGSGKTRTTFASVRRLYEMGKNPFPVLVVAPNSTKISWKREIEEVWPGLKVTVVNGTATQRRKQLEEFSGKNPCPIHNVTQTESTILEDTATSQSVAQKKTSRGSKELKCTCGGHVVVVNWEAVAGHSRLAKYGNIALKRCVECGGADEKVTPAKCQVHLKELNHINFQTVIADEAHRMKDGASQQARALKAATGDAPYRFALTGTPVANTPDDLWSILNWMYPEAFPSKTKFIDRYLDVSLNAYGAINVLGIKSHMEPEFFGFLDPILRRMPKEVILPFLPPVVYERRDVEMAPKQKKAYEQMRDKMVAELDDGDLLITTSPLTKMTRLLQFAAAYAEMEEVEVTHEDGTKSTELKAVLSEPSSKLDAFMDDIEGFGDESVVVFSASKQLINMLGKRMDKAGIRYGRITGDEDSIERQIHMDNFQNGKVQFILCTTGAGGTGITLTKASTAVYLSRPWSNIDSEQSEGRIHRLGSEQHDHITYIDYVTTGTVEETVFDALFNKSVQLQTILRDENLIRKAMNGEIIEKTEIKDEETNED